MKNMFIVSMAFVVLAAIAFSAMPASAEIVLYEDSFSRGTVAEPAALHDSSPETAYNGYGASSTATWVSASNHTTDGSLLNLDSNPYSQGSAACLPFEPESGYVYTFSATIQAVDGGGNDTRWLGMGFCTSSYTSNCEPHKALDPYAWTLFRVTPTSSVQNTCFTGVDTADGQGIGTDSGELDVEIVLDTTGASWSYDYIVEDTSKRTVAFSANPDINFIWFGTVVDTTGTVDNVKLTVNAEVPEPSAIALLATGLIGLLAYAWRKRK